MAGVDFFVSHAGRDQAWAEWVAWHLVAAGYTVELDSWDWAVGENFVTKMHEALGAADRVVALFSPAYFEDLRYTIEEWTSALIKDTERGHRLVPVDHYLDLLETRAEELLDQSAPQSHPSSLVAAIRVSTDRLAEVDPAALALVRIGAFLASEPIPADVLIGRIAATGYSWPPNWRL